MMNSLGATWLSATVQVTVLGLIAAAVQLRPGRRGAGASAFAAAASLLLCLVLTGLQFCPLPDWWSWSCLTIEQERADPRPAVAATVTDDAGDAPARDGAAHTAIAVPWQRWWARLQEGLTTAANVGWRWTAWLGLALAGGCAWILFRLLLGLVALRALRRRSRPVTDAGILGLLDSLRRELGCRSPVDVGETSDLTTAATIGWRRPVILLPDHWRSWTDAERRAVLAHELAHIRRGDFALGVISRLALAAHWFHPVVHWLSRRLRLHQEMAADDVAARVCGGRAGYLRALARLTLAHDRSPMPGLLQAFFSSTGTLERRIDMLRKHSDSLREPSRWMRGGVFAALAVAALALSALRGMAQTDDKPNTTAQARQKTHDSHRPFDLSYLSDDVIGVVAFRPAELFAQPGMKAYADIVNKSHAEMLKYMGVGQWGTDVLGVEHLDQVVAKVMHTFDEKQPEGRRNSILTGITLVRMAKDFDWRGYLLRNHPKLQETTHLGRKYLKGSIDDMTVCGRGGCFYIADARTLVIETEPQMKKLLERKPGQRPGWLWAKGWQKVERSLFAGALDFRNPWTKDIKAMKAKGAEADSDYEDLISAFLLETQTTVVGIDAREKVTLQSWSQCPSEAHARAVAAKATAIREKIGPLLAEARRAQPVPTTKEQPDAISVEMVAGLLATLSIEVSGDTIRLGTAFPIDLPAIARLIYNELKE